MENIRVSIEIIDNREMLCAHTLEMNMVRVGHFKVRWMQYENHDDLVIVVINVDDPNGNAIAEALMPGHDWQQYRDRGEIPFARGMAGKQFMRDCINLINSAKALELDTKPTVPVVVIDHGIVCIYTV